MNSLHALIHGRPEDIAIFYLGVFCYVLLRADMAIKSRANGVSSTLQYIKLHARVLFVRIAVATVTFFGIVPEDGFAIPGVSGFAVYFFSGLGVDALLDKICQKVPWLKVMLPPPQEETHGPSN